MLICWVILDACKLAKGQKKAPRKALILKGEWDYFVSLYATT